MREPLTVARSIGDRFVAWQGTIGRPDPQKCPFVTTGRGFGPTHAHSPPYLAQALYRLLSVPMTRVTKKRRIGTRFFPLASSATRCLR